MIAEWPGTVGHHSALIGAAWRCAGMRVWFYYFPCGFTTAKGSRGQTHRRDEESAPHTLTHSRSTPRRRLRSCVLRTPPPLPTCSQSLAGLRCCAGGPGMCVPVPSDRASESPDAGGTPPARVSQCSHASAHADDVPAGQRMKTNLPIINNHCTSRARGIATEIRAQLY